MRAPCERWAEVVCAGVAVDSPAGARSVAGLSIEDFTHPTLAGLWQAGVACRAPYRWSGLRTRAVARRARVTNEVAEGVRTMIPILADTTGHYAAILRDATIRRRLLAEVLEVVQALEDGGDLADALAILERCLAVGRGEPVGVLVGARAGSLATEPAT